jgi:hypothetical protein
VPARTRAPTLQDHDLFIARSFDKEITLILDRRGDDVKITEKVVEEVARKRNNGEKVMKMLHDRRGDDIKISERVARIITRSINNLIFIVFTSCYVKRLQYLFGKTVLSFTSCCLALLRMSAFPGPIGKLGAGIIPFVCRLYDVAKGFVETTRVWRICSGIRAGPTTSPDMTVIRDCMKGRQKQHQRGRLLINANR